MNVQLCYVCCDDVANKIWFDLIIVNHGELWSSLYFVSHFSNRLQWCGQYHANQFSVHVHKLCTLYILMVSSCYIFLCWRVCKKMHTRLFVIRDGFFLAPVSESIKSHLIKSNEIILTIKRYFVRNMSPLSKTRIWRHTKLPIGIEQYIF